MLAVNGADLIADPSGVLYWPAENLLAVADLHFEKGTGLAAAGAGLIPPYDTRATLQRLGAAIRRLAPAVVICLGDSFHDAEAERRLGETETAMIRAQIIGIPSREASRRRPFASPASCAGRTARTARAGPRRRRKRRVRVSWLIRRRSAARRGNAKDARVNRQ